MRKIQALNVRRPVLLLALACCLLTGCRKESRPLEEPTGTDWRTYGWVSGSESVLLGGETKQVLVCVFDENAALYLDDASQTIVGTLPYPQPMENAREAYQSCSVADQNGDGSSDISLTFADESGAQTVFTWYWTPDGFVSQPQ